MSAARTSSACCCVCPPPSCCCDCMEVSTDVTITASHNYESSCLHLWCDSVCDPSDSYIEESHTSSFLANGNIKYVQERNEGGHKRQFDSPIPVNDPYGSGRFEGDIVCGGSGNGSGNHTGKEVAQFPRPGNSMGEPPGDPYCYVSLEQTFNYTVVWEQVTLSDNVIVGSGPSGNANVATWDYGTSDGGFPSGYNCGTDDCRLLIHSLRGPYVQVRRIITGTFNEKYYNNATELNDDTIPAGSVITYEQTIDFSNRYPEIIIDVPLGVVMRYPGEYRDCETNLGDDFQVVASDIEQMGEYQFCRNFGIPDFLSCASSVSNPVLQDGCDELVTESDRKMGVWTNVASDIETGPECPNIGDSRFQNRSAVVNSRATIKHNIANSSLIGIPCPPIP